jgi:hypothetical protein
MRKIWNFLFLIYDISVERGKDETCLPYRLVAVSLYVRSLYNCLTRKLSIETFSACHEVKFECL